MKPPPTLDGARVLFWAWFEPPLFLSGGSGRIHGAAVAQYSSGQIYRFHCDQDWEVQGDWDCESVEEAMGTGLTRFATGPVSWRPCEA